MRRQVFSIVLGALALTAPTAWGTTVAFDMTADCIASCQNINMAPDEVVVGRVVLSTANFAASGPVTRADLVDFEILFGTTSAAIFKRGSPAYGFEATWGANAGVLDGVRFVASGSGLINDPGPLFFAGVGGNTLSLRGICNDVDCGSVSPGATASIRPPTFRPVDVVPVPLPPAALLIVAGAGALAAASRRRPGRSSGT